MKKFYAFAAAVVAALSMNAQLYVVGSGSIGETALGWDPASPCIVEAGANGYEFTLTQPNGGVKFSTAMGDWDTFNAGCLYAAVTEDNLDKALTLENNSGPNLLFPWNGDWKCVIAADFSTLTVTALTEKPEGPVPVYVRGGMNNWLNDIDGETAEEKAARFEKWQFKSEDGVNYSLVCSIEAGVEFKIADGSWGAINYTANEEIFLEDDGTYTSVWGKDGANTTLAENFEGTISFTLPASEEGLEVKFVAKGAAGIDSVVAEENVPAVYYNLQGVKVANPENGIYVVRQGDKVSKVLVK